MQSIRLRKDLSADQVMINDSGLSMNVEDSYKDKQSIHIFFYILDSRLVVSTKQIRKSSPSSTLGFTTRMTFPPSVFLFR